MNQRCTIRRKKLLPHTIGLDRGFKRFGNRKEIMLEMQSSGRSWKRDGPVITTISPPLCFGPIYEPVTYLPLPLELTSCFGSIDDEPETSLPLPLDSTTLFWPIAFFVCISWSERLRLYKNRFKKSSLCRVRSKKKDSL